MGDTRNKLVAVSIAAGIAGGVAAEKTYNEAMAPNHITTADLVTSLGRTGTIAYIGVGAYCEPRGLYKNVTFQQAERVVDNYAEFRDAAEVHSISGAMAEQQDQALAETHDLPSIKTLSVMLVHCQALRSQAHGQ